ncbi:phosphatidylinositol 3,4,5-trisphosphate 3-phosphatase and dual-specificity protein phosphatase PTEN-like [Acanthaster planci]|uniref:Phosphatidylinositol 3,4,5-trisphosphate 3-phosphatase and dual-specificity protein phosphatase PTEN n=1 Tax=Acanthaster planci TaxID=133434 RepID=A0A8B7XHG3_ACAPL|nr:phosphatidylinositol 3,4,5-trisphosphate 3-phosphatase and dual-specificity protein phosphatase PTEN-like [Acanthaster planci]
MAAKLRELVSKNKTRYIDDNFDLDLTYICNNVIAMGFPAQSLESVYRNDMESVVKFLDKKHPDHYKVYNLCSERNYDTSKFYNRVAHYPFDDHNPPKIELIQPFCDDVEKWLKEGKENVAVIHCKAGKGRTGVMICALLLHQGKCKTAEEAMEKYGEKRTRDGKGVTIPSQRRYVQYYGEIIRNKLTYETVTLLLQRVQLETVPMMSNGSCCPYFVVYKQKVKVYTSEVVKGIKRGERIIEFDIPTTVPICGDVKVEFFHKPSMLDKKSMFHFWFNTFFVIHPITEQGRPGSATCNTEVIPVANGGEELVMGLNKDALDKAYKDKTNKLYSPNLKIRLYFTRGNNGDMDKRSPNLEDSMSPCGSSNDLLETESWESEDEACEDWEDGTVTYV